MSYAKNYTRNTYCRSYYSFLNYLNFYIRCISITVFVNQVRVPPVSLRWRADISNTSCTNRERKLSNFVFWKNVNGMIYRKYTQSIANRSVLRFPQTSFSYEIWRHGKISLKIEAVKSRRREGCKSRQKPTPGSVG